MRPLTRGFLLTAATALFACTPTPPRAKETSHTNQVTKINQQSIGKLKEPKIIVRKSEHILQVFDGKNLVRQYPIGLGFNPKGTKSREGDDATPEGNYYITHKNPKSNYYLSLSISYPTRVMPTAASTQV
jgi:murein L,D-transpeptidase YafK